MLKKFIKIFVFIYFLLIPIISNADTHVYANDVRQGWIWNKEGSPYILEEPIYIPDGYSFSVSAGVTIMSASTTDDQDPNSLTIDGNAVISGTHESPVHFLDLNSIYFSHSSSVIANALFERTGLNFSQSTSTLNNVVIKDSFSAITAKRSHVDVKESILSNNHYGIASYEYRPIFQVRAVSDGGIGGIGNAVEGVADMILDPEQNVITIHDSTVSDNMNFGILNQTVNPVDATNNWWGNSDGPRIEEIGGGDRISGFVNSTPWKDKNPKNPICCSNVLFIPGIEASRLYTGTNRLWEPNRNDDVKKMYMSVQGISIDRSIQPKGIIDSAYGVKDIYKSFIVSMDKLVTDGSVHEWASLPYDWRKGAYDIVDEKVLNRIYDLASSSQTGKITIIAHSNGGLVAKALMKTLEDRGRSNIVENTLFVAVPELGTPQSLLSMLHGHSQSIAGGLFLSEANARTFSQNLPGAYGLLPSRKYFEKNPSTVISDLFSSNSNLFSFDAMKKFLTTNSFSKASSTDINTPLILNSLLFSRADSFHSIFDSWKPASTSRTLSIFGWGLPTSKAINYEKDAHCQTKNKCEISVFRTITSKGDGTVMTSSYASTTDRELFLNLKKLNLDTKKNIEHANILEAPVVQDLVRDTVTHKQNASDYGKYFSTIEPTDTTRWLYIKIYSPIDIHVYDKKGNHTGLIENPQADVNLNNYENNIPSSIYDGWGRTKQVIVPYDQDYQIVLEGNATGTFSIAAQVVDSDKVIASTTFSELPVSPVMNADFVIASSTVSFATSTSIYIDADGDGISETIHASDQFLKAHSKKRNYFEKFKKIIKRLTKERLEKHKGR